MRREDVWTGERLARPGVWVAGRALLLTLTVLLAITFDRAAENDLALGGMSGALVPEAGWPFPLGYLAALVVVYVTSSLYLALGPPPGSPMTLAVLALDVPVVAAIVHWTGGVDSSFVLVYLPLVLAAGVLRGAGGGLGLAALSALSYLVVLGAESMGWLAARGYAGAMPQVLALEGSDPVRVGLYVLMVLGTGLVGGQLGRMLAERTHALRATSRELERTRLDTSYVIEQLGSGLLSLDEEGRITLLNGAAGRMLEVIPEGVLGRRALETMPPRLDALVRWLEEARRGRVPLVRQELEIERADGGPLPLGITGWRTAPGGAGNGRGEPAGRPTALIALFQDLTRARQEESERVRKERLAVIGGLAAGIAHEIRNCVKPISGSLDVLRRELPLEGANQRLMELAVRECTRLGSFVQAMLDYGRVNPLVLDPAPLDLLVEEVAEMVSVLELARGHRVELRIAERARQRSAQIDREQLKQVLLNLAVNGLEAMGGAAGSLMLSLDVEASPTEVGAGAPPRREGAAPDPQPSPGTVAPAAELGEERLVLGVRDTGPGMDAERRGQIFEPFFTTKRGGTGFGLSIAASIVERHGGVLEVESAPGQGAQFRIRLRERALLEAERAA